MANPQLESFLVKAKADPALLQRLQACPNLDAVAALGLGLGYSFSNVDLVRHQAEATLRLGEEDLAAVAAGVHLQGHIWLINIVWA